VIGSLYIPPGDCAALKRLEQVIGNTLFLYCAWTRIQEMLGRTIIVLESHRTL